jgi:cell pole-organizing protein PopZ
MTQAAKSQEPSMEEILASIRRIIADDDAKPAPVALSASPEPPPPTPASVQPRQSAPPPPPIAALPPAPPRPDPSALIKEAALKQGEIDRMLKDDVEAVRPQPEAEEIPDVLDLTESMVATPPPAAGSRFQTIDGESDVIFSEPEPIRQPTAAKVIPEPPSATPQFVRERSLLSSSTSAAVDSAFNTLAHTVLVQNSRTLEDLVREMLRPLLKGWLDDNLPNIVERLVKAEIERVSRGRS